MVGSLLPRQIDNSYRGRKLAVWLFALIVSVRIAQSLGVIFGGHAVVSSVDGIPIDAYAPAAAQTIVSISALLGLLMFLIGLLCILVLVRYRSLIPFMFVLLLLQHVGKTLILHFAPIARVGAPPEPVVNLVLLALMIVGLVLSLWKQDEI